MYSRHIAEALRGEHVFWGVLQNDSELRDAIDVVSAHTFSEIPLTKEQREMAEAMGKPIWNSEDHVYRMLKSV